MLHLAIGDASPLKPGGACRPFSEIFLVQTAQMPWGDGWRVRFVPMGFIVPWKCWFAPKKSPLLILWAVINSAVFAEGMGGVAVEDEMEKRKHTECHLRLSAFLCVPVSDVRFGRRWQGAERSKLKQWKQNVLNLSSITRAFSLRLPHSVSRFFSLSVALLQRRLWAVQGVCVCVCLGKTVTRCLCVSVKGPYKGNSDQPTTLSAK